MQLSTIYQAALLATPDKAAYICGDTAVSYRLLDENARRYATALKKMGIGAGDRVALSMHNLPQLPQLYFALYRLGAIAVPISPYSTAAEMNYALVHCSARLLLVSRKLFDTACEAVANAPLIEKTLVVDDQEKIDNSFDCPSAELPLDACDLAPSNPAMILYTSGSTAQPKGIIYTRRSLHSAAVNRCGTLLLTGADLYFNAGYLCHGAALTTALLPVLFAGGTALFPVSFNPADFLPLVSRYKPTIAALGPSQLWAILDHRLCASTDFSSLRYVTAGGDVVSSQLHERFLQTMKFPLSESIGMTECGTYMTTAPGMSHKTGSMGKPVLGTEVRLVDEQGVEVKTGEIGQIVVRTETCMSGYWNDEENTARALVDGWLQTGDAARQDGDGYYYFADRIKNMLVRDCCNISPTEVEDAIRQHPAVKDCGIVGIPDPRHGQKVIAFVQLQAGADPFNEAALETFTASIIMGPRLPDRWVQATELPATQLGKLDRKKLQQMASVYGDRS
jgi:acyl-CoA synthetase (AMP-forming)/AMP-acid ligase II